MNYDGICTECHINKATVNESVPIYVRDANGDLKEHLGNFELHLCEKCYMNLKHD